MVFCPHCAHDSYSWSLSNPSSLLPSRLHPLIILFSFLSIFTGVQGRREEGPTFDTITFSDLTPCNPVTFAWTGGFSPFSLVIYNDDTGNTFQEFDGLEGSPFSWTPPQRAVGKFLYAVVYDNDDFSDDTDDFVVQSASCSSSVPPSPSTTTFSPVTPSTTSVASFSHTSEVNHSSAHQPSVQLPPSSSSTPASSSNFGGSSSPSSQGFPRSSSTTQPSNNTSTFSTTETSSSSSNDGSTSSPTSSSTTPAEQSTLSRPHRKSTTSAGEIAGIVLGAVAILAMLVGLVTWWLLIRRRTRDRAREPDDDKYTALHSSRSTQHEPSLSRPRSAGSKAAIRRHAYSGASPTTTAAPTSLLDGGSVGGVDSAVEWDREGGDVLYLHAGRAPANSLSVEPPTPQPFQLGFDFDQRHGRPQPGVLSPLSVLAPLRPMMKVTGGEAGTRGDGRTTAVAAGSPATAAAGATKETEPRGARREARPPPREVDPDTKLAEERDRGAGGEVRSAVVRARTRLTIIESDAGVRLAGGPPGLALLPLDTDSAAITTLPPPYRHYDSSSVS